MAMLTKVLTVFGVLALVVALLIARYPSDARHFAVQLTHGKPPFRALSDSCSYEEVPRVDPAKSSRFTVHKHCFNASGELFWYDVNHDAEQTEKILKEKIAENCPVLIHRPFRTHKCLAGLYKLAEDNKNFTVRVKQNNGKKGFDLFPSPKQVSSLSKGGEQRPIIDLFNEFKQGYTNNYTAFDLTLTDKEYLTLWDMNVDFIGGRLGSTFFSNFNETFVTTPFHAAWVNSFAYQCAGQKKWYLLTPEDSTPTLQYQGFQGFMKDCNGREDYAKVIFPVRTDEDTLFFFPIFWAHAVETTKGLSVLLNYRNFDLKKPYKYNIFRGLTVQASLINRLIFRSWDPEDILSYILTGKKPAKFQEGALSLESFAENNSFMSKFWTYVAKWNAVTAEE